jgi:hypothetical protein
MPPDPAQLADGRPDPGPPQLPGVLPDGRVWIDAEELRFLIEELQTAVALLRMKRLSGAEPDPVVMANNLIRIALARLPGWLLEEPS